MSNTTTGSDRVVPDQQPPEERRTSPLTRLTGSVAAHWQFAIVVAVAVMMRIIVMLGYPPVLWFDDSYNYVYDAFTHRPDVIRANGYPFFLQLFLPLHSLYPAGLIQAAMGVTVGIVIYALLRRRGLPWWGAALAAVPVLFDSYQLHLEHMITSDVLFVFLVTVAIVILCWNDRPSVLVMAVAGLLIGYATLVRSVGQPLLVVILLAMLVRRVGWRRLVTLLVAGVVPIAGYMIWFHSSTGKYAMTQSLGPFLYSRVSAFSDCSKLNPPADLRFLCDKHPPQDRPPASQYIWADNDLPVNGKVTYTPLYDDKRFGPDTNARFGLAVSAQEKQFAEFFIKQQPVTYLRVVGKDVLHTFGWNREPDPGGVYETANGNGPTFRFLNGAQLTRERPWYTHPTHLPGTPPQSYCDATCQRGDPQAGKIQAAERAFAGPGLGATRAVGPWDSILRWYQKYFFLRGTMLAVAVLIGLAGVLARWRRWGGLALLPWLVGALLIVLPPMTAGFSYRYVLAAAPVACLAAGLAFAREPGEMSAGTRIAGLRRHLGRRRAVEQE
ncbi:MAG TPA: hypothetical protein VFQ68_19375 [Streptosporangiaceae bacterium]|nr:hypothetical protein [Streptosporangiaceae bacterium]